MTAAELLESAGFVQAGLGWQIPGEVQGRRAYLPRDPELALRFATAIVRGRHAAADGDERARLDDWLRRATDRLAHPAAASITG